MAAIKPERVLEIIEAVACRLIPAVVHPAVGLQQDRRTKIPVRIPPVAGAGRRAAGAKDALVEAIQLLAILPRLLPLGRRHRRVGLQPRLDRPQLGVEVRHVGNQVLDDGHVRQWIDFDRALHVIHRAEARERVRAVDVHRAAAAYAFAARAAEGQRRVDLALDLHQRIENHGAARGAIHPVSIHMRVLAVIRIPPVDLELLPVPCF